MASKVASVTLNNGKKMPLLGLGTWKSDPGKVEQAVKDAIDAGYRHIDCAMIYGNEKEVGAALKAKISDGTVKREDLFITSKLWNTYHSQRNVLPALKKTLSDLGLEYVDMYLIHWPVGFKEDTGDLLPQESPGKFQMTAVDYVDTWRGMEGCVKEGLAKSIGISNFNKAQTERVLAGASIVPATNQVESHPYLNQTKLKEYSESKGIVLTAYSPLGSPDRPDAKAEQQVLMEDPKLVAMAAKYGKSVAQVLIKYQVQRGLVCIPKSVTKSRIIANIDVWDFSLSEDDLKELNSFTRVERYCDGLWCVDHEHFPFKDEY